MWHHFQDDFLCMMILALSNSCICFLLYFIMFDVFIILFLFLFIFYLLDRERHSKRGNTSRRSSRRRGRSRLPTEQGAQCGAHSQYPGIMTQAEGRCLMNSATQEPLNYLLLFHLDRLLCLCPVLSFGTYSSVSSLCLTLCFYFYEWGKLTTSPALESSDLMKKRS